MEVSWDDVIYGHLDVHSLWMDQQAVDQFYQQIKEDQRKEIIDSLELMYSHFIEAWRYKFANPMVRRITSHAQKSLEYGRKQADQELANSANALLNKLRSKYGKEEINYLLQ